MEGNEHIDGYLKKKLESFSRDPHFSSFDKTMKKLERKKRRRFFFYILFSGILLSGAIGIFSFLNTDKNISANYTRQEINKENPAETISVKPVPSTLEVTTENNEIKNANNKQAKPQGQKNEPEKAFSSVPATKNGKTVVSNNEVIRTKPKQKAPAIDHKIYPSQKDQDKNYTEPHVINNSTVSNLPLEKPIVVYKRLIQQPTMDSTGNNGHVPGSVKDSSLVTDTVPIIAKEKIPPFQLSPDTLPAKKIKTPPVFIAGISVEPQVNRFQYSANLYSPLTKNFTDEYLEEKKKQNQPVFNFNLGLKGGVILKNKWELLIGLGYQRINYTETFRNLADTTTVYFGGNLFAPSGLGNNYNGIIRTDAMGAEVPLNKPVKNNFRYVYYSFSASRIILFPNFIKVKIGAGVQINQLLNSNAASVDGMNYIYYARSKAPSYNQFVSTFNVKAALIEDLTPRLQLQFCPTLFYSPSSMFKKNYLIDQKSYGAGLEFLLVYKFNGSLVH